MPENNEISKERLEKRWKKFQARLGYTDEELSAFRSFPNNARTVESTPDLMKYDAVVEVIAAKNCVAGYKVGDKFRINPRGFLVTEDCPKNLCVGAIAALKPLVSYLWQAIYNGSTDIIHDTMSCPDVDVHLGGSGQITMRIYAVPVEKKDV
jgi:uncharacterized repeat protein (TIGR04076 family)